MNHFIKYYFNISNTVIHTAECSCGEKFNDWVKAWDHSNENIDQSKIYKGFDSIMQALLEGKKLKPKNKKLFGKQELFEDNCIKVKNFEIMYIQIRKEISSERIHAYLINDCTTTYQLSIFDIYNSLEFEEYQEPDLKLSKIKEYTISELEQKLGEKIRIVGEGD